MKKDVIVEGSKQYRRSNEIVVDVNSVQNDEKVAQIRRFEKIEKIRDNSDTENVVRHG